MFATNAGDGFVPPPDCPVFEPTWDEFRDAMSYIASIRAIAEKSGICKIRPPPEWQPPFVIDMDSFRFIPRIQKLNELEAQSRVKIIFLNGLAKFWELQGIQLKIPMVDRKYLDLCKLQKIVREEGGFIMVSNERKWARVANRMNYAPGKGISSTLRSHYDRILYPYDLFQAGVTADSSQFVGEEKDKGGSDVKLTELEDDPNGAEQTSSEMKPKHESSYVTRTKSRMMRDAKMGRVVPDRSSGALVATQLQRKIIQENNSSSPVKNKEKKLITSADQYFCQSCNRGDSENLLLLCDGCDDAYHTFCLLPPLNDVPVGDWRCPKCVAKECHKPVEAYGFEQAEREYTLESFGEMADKFKAKYFKMLPHLVPTATVEKEFWRLVSCLDEDVVVEYGADIHAAERGSGFPTIKNQAIVDDQNRMYVESGWNLNNLPVLPSSVLQFISADISGMKVPWCYVGMCFSSFSWHTEDHWSYSVNYMHWGEPKTWYGVPGAKAELLEECMKKIAPELFEQSPDLLHQLTTILNPNVLMAYGVPISRTDQHAGEFVITFPRSYHAGFNQGFNFAEAVNFCPADWIPYGRASVDHYKDLHRQCVFSNDELMCKMASVAETLDVSLARLIYEDLELIFEEELTFRKSLCDRGVTDLKKESFELLADDERQCVYCKTTCFLSSVTCSCVPNNMVCLDHVDHLCRCSYHKRCLCYQMTGDELETLLARVKNRSEALLRWQEAVECMMSLSNKEHTKPDLIEIKNLVHKAAHEKLPKNDQLNLLMSIVQEADKLQSAVNQLTGSKVRTRQRGNGNSKYTHKIKVDDIRSICRSIEGLQCNIKEADALKVLLTNIETFEEASRKVLDGKDLPSSAIVEEMLNKATEFLDVDLTEIGKLKEMLAQIKWLEAVEEALENQSSVSVGDVSHLINSGSNLAPHPSCEAAMAELQKFLAICHDLENRASTWLRFWRDSGSKVELVAVEELLEKARKFDVYIPDLELWKDYLQKVDDWTNKALHVINGTHLPHLEDIETLVSKGMQIPIGMELLDQMEQRLTDARSWLLNIAETLRCGNRQPSILQRLLKQFLHQRSPRFAEDFKNDLSCSMMEEYIAVKSTCCMEMEKKISQNVKKLEQMTDSPASCSVCRNEIVKLRRKCPVCRDVCHAKCLSQKRVADFGQKLFIACSSCNRPAHPKLETIESLVASYQALGVCLPIGEALSALLSQSSNWRRAVFDAFQTEELSTARRLLNELKDLRLKNKKINILSPKEECYEQVNVKPEVQVPVEHTCSVYSLPSSIKGDSMPPNEKVAKKKLYPMVKLSKQSQTLLEDLMLEGWIIDVEMEEMTEISHLIFYSQNGQRCKRKSSCLNSESNGCEQRQMKQCKLEKQQNPVPSDAFYQNIRDERTELNCSIRNNDGKKIAGGTKTVRRNRKSKQTEKPKKTEPTFSTNDPLSSSEDDGDECCSAEKCLRPKAKKVNWVQCDCCLLWYHLLCIGQKMNQIAREKDYLCTMCTAKRSPPSDLSISTACQLSSNEPETDCQTSSRFGESVSSENCNLLLSNPSSPHLDTVVITHDVLTQGIGSDTVVLPDSTFCKGM